MSNYTQSTFFGPKDALPPSDPNKVIFGAAYDTEFGNLATAVNSKVDTADPGLAIAGNTIAQDFANLQVLASPTLADTLAVVDISDSDKSKQTEIQNIIDLVPATEETVEGVIELATQTEVNAGTDAVRAVTPATLAAWSGAGAGGDTYINKTVDSVINNSATPADDGTLEFAVETGGIYAIKMLLRWNFLNAGTEGIVITFSGVNASDSYQIHALDIEESAATLTGQGNTDSGLTASIAYNDTNGQSRDHMVQVTMQYQAAGNGTFKVQYSQTSAVVANLTVREEGTYLQYRKLN